MNPRHAAFTLCSVLTTAALTSGTGCSASSSNSDPGGKRDGGDAPIVVYPSPIGEHDTNPGPACDLNKPFGAPELVPTVNKPGHGTGTFSSDERTIYIMNSRENWFHIYTATRPTLRDDFGAFTLLKTVNNGTTSGDYDPYLSADGLELYFSSERGGSGTSGQFDLFVATRTSPLGDFEQPIPISGVNTTAIDRTPAIVADKSTLYFASTGYDSSHAVICKAVRSGGSFINPKVVHLGETSWDGPPAPSADGLTLFFGSIRAGAKGAMDIWVAKHTKAPDDFDPPTNEGDVAALNGPSNEHPTWLSPDGCRLYFESDRISPVGTSDYNLYVATRPR